MKYEGRIGKQFKSFEVKELSFNGESRTISGYAAVFNNKDKAGDILIKGCFAKSIQDRGPESQANDKIIMLWQHDQHEPIGKITKLMEDEKGLYFEAFIDDVERGNQAIKQLESGTLNQFSIGYSYVWERCEYDNERDAFIVKEVVLYEISVVSIGCNGETEYLGLKAECADPYEEMKNEIESVVKGLNIRKKEEIYTIVRKALSLGQFKPNAPQKAVEPLEEVKADINNKVKLFGNIKLKSND
jgi:HK97 family phage prohead protease